MDQLRPADKTNLNINPNKGVCMINEIIHDDVIQWKHFPRYWPFVLGIHRSPVKSPQWRRALMFSLICARTNAWVNNGEAGDLRRHRPHYDVIVMEITRDWLIDVHKLCTNSISCHLCIILQQRNLLRTCRYENMFYTYITGSFIIASTYFVHMSWKHCNQKPCKTVVFV